MADLKLALTVHHNLGIHNLSKMKRKKTKKKIIVALVILVLLITVFYFLDKYVGNIFTIHN
ncbi:MAG: hypothetical protein BGP14_17435 [Sphingobacteriales bacterium 44-15]|nr:MAG: hypothetical protein BGP14_17435 [Sphingobacteriales bacterium 44-15]